MKSVAKLKQQIDDLALHLRTIRANVKRASKELDEGFERRNRRPLESSLRWKRYRDAADLQMIAEACLHDLRKAQAIRLAPFSPGDQIVATLTLKGYPPHELRCCIWDVEPTTRDQYSYQVVKITTAGALWKRRDIQPLSPDRFSICCCDAPLEKECEATLAWRRRSCEEFVERTVNGGLLDAYTVEERGWGGTRFVRRLA